MHPRFEKDYQYLLASLIPRYLLSSNRIEGILDALTSNDRSKMIKEAFLAMEELVLLGDFSRDRPHHDSGRVTLSYIRKDGKARYTLEMAETEWVSLDAVAEKPEKGIVSSVFEGIISSMSLDESGGTLSERVESLLDMVKGIRSDLNARIAIFDQSSKSGLRESDSIRLVSWNKLVSDSPYRRAVNNGRIHTEVKKEEITPEKNLFKTDPQSIYIVLIPLQRGGRRFGLMQLDVHGREYPGNESLYNCYLLGRSIVKLIENNNHLEERVSIDRLTGVYNRNFYESQLSLEMERASRNRKSLGFLIMDIDDFKRFNDLYGHDIGDRVLKTVATTVRGHLRKIDLFFRFGGEEFVALLPGADMEAAERTAERIREVIEKTRMKLEDGSAVKITLSIGGCVYPRDAENEKELFRKADQMLLEAKQLGKNMIRFYRGDTERD
ncbi:MAG: GGDEF domain-containing protein [Candidatus Krumholzibacteriota bacterium]|nr:GGDEF domain-containing protein [Candidatus Krumholzibacteriota bacterium]